MFDIEDRISNLKTRLVVAKAWSDAAREAAAEARRSRNTAKATESRNKQLEHAGHIIEGGKDSPKLGLHQRAYESYGRAASHYEAGRENKGAYHFRQAEQYRGAAFGK